VAELVAAAEAGKVRLAVIPMVLAEAVFVLTGFYGHPRPKVAEVLSHLIWIKERECRPIIFPTIPSEGRPVRPPRLLQRPSPGKQILSLTPECR